MNTGDRGSDFSLVGGPREIDPVRLGRRIWHGSDPKWYTENAHLDSARRDAESVCAVANRPSPLISL
jgi:hypothetical protein